MNTFFCVQRSPRQKTTHKYIETLDLMAILKQTAQQRKAQEKGGEAIDNKYDSRGLLNVGLCAHITENNIEHAFPKAYILHINERAQERSENESGQYKSENDGETDINI